MFYIDVFTEVIDTINKILAHTQNEIVASIISTENHNMEIFER